MAAPLIDRIKILLLVSSLVICVTLGLEAKRENLGMVWRTYQKMYRNDLVQLASSESEKKLARTYEIRMRQIVLPGLRRSDRCVICHVGMEDPRMADREHPLRSHPGDHLEIHDTEIFGCTICHDGQGQAITTADAHAQGDHFFWEKPLVPKPFTQSNCLRCHAPDDLPKGSLARKGRDLFFQNGCLGCHNLHGKGASIGLDLSHLGDASFHMKRPTGPHEEKYLRKFCGNKNIAYIYESIAEPTAQPKSSLMIDFHFSEDEILALTTFLKGMTDQNIPNSFLPGSFFKKLYEEKTLTGKEVHTIYCSACHGKEAQGGVKNPNTHEGAIPALVRSKESFTVNEISRLIVEGKIAERKNPDGAIPLNMPAWQGILSEGELASVIDYLFSLMPEEVDDW